MTALVLPLCAHHTVEIHSSLEEKDAMMATLMLAMAALLLALSRLAMTAQEHLQLAHHIVETQSS